MFCEGGFMRSCWRFAILLGTLLVPVFGQDSNQDWRFADPKASLVGGIRLGAVLQSPILNAAIAQASAKDPSAAAMVGMVRTMLGNVAEVRFSVRDNGTKDPEVVALITGKLDDGAAG